MLQASSIATHIMDSGSIYQPVIKPCSKLVMVDIGFIRWSQRDATPVSYLSNNNKQPHGHANKANKRII